MTSWYALEAMDEAVEEAKELLFPFDAWTWAKIALLVLFTSGMGIPSNIPTPGGNTDTSEFGGYDSPSPYGQVLDTVNMPATGMVSAADAMTPAIYGVVAIILLIFAALMAAATVLEFVYYKSLLDKEVVIRRNFRDYLGKGLRLFVFRAAVLIAIILGAVGLFGTVRAPSTLVVAILAALPAVIVFAVFLQLTNQFIPLVMIEHDVALIPAWKIFYATLQEEWKQIGLFVIARVVLGLAVGILVLLASLVLVLPAIPVVVAVILLDLSMTVMIGLGVAGLLVGLALVLYFFRVPAQTYLRYYTILVYQKLDV